MLSNEQKSVLCQLARQAYDAWAGREAWEECNAVSASKCFELWRRAEQRKAVGIASLRDCGNEHFLPIKAHWQNLRGDSGVALKTLLRHEEEPRIAAFHKLKAELALRGLADEYAGAICRRQFRCELAHASAKQLWCLVFTIRNRRQVARPEAQRRAPRYVKSDFGALSAANPF